MGTFAKTPALARSTLLLSQRSNPTRCFRFYRILCMRVKTVQDFPHNADCFHASPCGIWFRPDLPRIPMHLGEAQRPLGQQMLIGSASHDQGTRMRPLRVGGAGLVHRLGTFQTRRVASSPTMAAATLALPSHPWSARAPPQRHSHGRLQSGSVVRESRRPNRLGVARLPRSQAEARRKLLRSDHATRTTSRLGSLVSSVSGARGSVPRRGSRECRETGRSGHRELNWSVEVMTRRGVEEETVCEPGCEISERGVSGSACC